MADLIGTGRCAIGCGSNKARYSVSAKQLAVCTCNACNMQVFARSDRSDEILRANIIKADPAPADPPAADPAPSLPADQPADPPKKKSIGWGMLRGLEV
jgi:hypothetical protein